MTRRGGGVEGGSPRIIIIIINAKNCICVFWMQNNCLTGWEDEASRDIGAFLERTRFGIVFTVIFV